MPNNYGNSVVSVVNAYNTVAPINSNTTLNANSFNRAYTITGAFAVTLPLISSGVATNFILFMNDTSAATAVIAAQGSDVIRVIGANATSINLLQGDTVLLESNGSNWVIANNSFAKANLASPTFTGTPAAPTAAPGTNTTQLATTQFVQTSLSALNTVPPGGIMHFPYSTAPAGWIKANGAIVSRTGYAALFSAIGTTFGAGDGSTTFKLPDLRGEFIRSWDDSRGVDTGRTISSYQASEFGQHNHGISVSDHNHYYWNGSACAVTVGDGSWVAAGTTETLTSGAYGMSASADYRGGVETRPRNFAFLACIKY